MLARLSIATVVLLALSAAAARADDTADDKSITNTLKMKLALVPAGEFMMGTQESDDALAKDFPDAAKDSFDDERPQHKVRITKPFFMGTANVTLAAFREFVDATGYQTEAEKDGRGGWGYDADNDDEPFALKPDYTWRSWGFEQSDRHPVVNVSWNDAVAFCKWLSEKEGKTYRLPTEAEFEYAARAGTTTRFPNGDDPEKLAEYANVMDASLLAEVGGTFRDENINSAIKGNDGYPFTATIRKFKPNAFGLYDMHGNAASWCSDWYGDDYYDDAPTVSEDPKGPTSGTVRVIRGGSWNSAPVDCRSSSRDADDPTYRSYDLGFRVVCEK